VRNQLIDVERQNELGVIVKLLMCDNTDQSLFVFCTKLSPPLKWEDKFDTLYTSCNSLFVSQTFVRMSKSSRRQFSTCSLCSTPPPPGPSPTLRVPHPSFINADRSVILPRLPAPPPPLHPHPSNTRGCSQT
jgi:hypothetical protein